MIRFLNMLLENGQNDYGVKQQLILILPISLSDWMILIHSMPWIVPEEGESMNG
jgi:hypothetical protein